MSPRSSSVKVVSSLSHLDALAFFRGFIHFVIADHFKGAPTVVGGVPSIPVLVAISVGTF